MADKILIADDDEALRSELRECLEGYETIEAHDGEGALKLLSRANEIGLVILDVKMPGVDGLDVLTEIKKKDPDLKIIILTGHSSKDVAIEALKGRADDYLEKPVDIDNLKEAVERLLESKRGEDTVNSQGLKGKIEKVKRFMEKNWYKKITLKEAASAVYLSPKYLSRIFKGYSRGGFNDYKLSLKVNKAKDLLKKSGYNINQISEKIGYENAESFIRQFRKLTGCTPTEYRKKGRPGKDRANRHKAVKRKLKNRR